MKPITLLFMSAAVSLLSLSAVAFETSGRSLIIVDHNSGMVLAEKNADQLQPPASMSKLMTVYMTFEALAAGRLGLDSKLRVSPEAVKYRGSSMFLKSGERISVEDLLRGVIVLSGNDASAVLAEALSPDGTEAGFARLTNARALEIGLTNSNFTNSNGWPDPNHLMSARDLATLSSRLITDFPDLYGYFAEKEFAFDNRVPENRRNRNPLLKLDFGADGLKTGYTQAAGYGIVGSVVRDNRRVIFVVTGLKSRSIRETEAEKIVNWYFFQFNEQTLFEPGDTVLSVPVWMGVERQVAVTVPSAAKILVSASSKQEISAEAIFEDIVEAPVAKGEQLGTLRVIISGADAASNVPLVAANDIERGGFGVRLLTAVLKLFDRSFGRLFDL